MAVGIGGSDMNGFGVGERHMAMTINKAQEALKLYLNGDIGIETLEERVISLAWDAEFEEQHLIDQVAIELSYLKDGASDEGDFRAGIAKIATPPKQDAIIAVRATTRNALRIR